MAEEMEEHVSQMIARANSGSPEAKLLAELDVDSVTTDTVEKMAEALAIDPTEKGQIMRETLLDMFINEIESYGAYDGLSDLESAKLVEIIPDSMLDNTTYRLTEMGRRVAGKILEKQVAEIRRIDRDMKSDEAEEAAVLVQTVLIRKLLLSESVVSPSETKEIQQYCERTFTKPGTLGQLLIADPELYEKGNEDGILIQRDGLVPTVDGMYLKSTRRYGAGWKVTLTEVPDSADGPSSAYVFIDEDTAGSKSEYVIAKPDGQGSIYLFSARPEDAAHLLSVQLTYNEIIEKKPDNGSADL